MSFYQNVSKLCANEGITVNGLIVKLGMSKSNGKSWRSGAVPQAATLKKVADHFGVTPDFLLNGEVDLASNHGILSHAYAPVLAANGTPTSADDDILNTLTAIYHKLDSVGKARLLIYANDLTTP